MKPAMEGRTGQALFFPSHCLEKPSGYMVGCFDHIHGRCCVTDIITSIGDSHSHGSYQSRQEDASSICIVGLWVNRTESNPSPLSPQKDTWFHMEKHDLDIPKCHVVSPPGGDGKSDNVMLVLYNGVLDAAGLLEKADKLYPWLAHQNIPSSNLRFITESCISHWRQDTTGTSRSSADGHQRTLPRLPHLYIGWLSPITLLWYRGLLTFLTMISCAVVQICTLQLLNNRVFQFIFSLPASFLQLWKKCQMLAEVSHKNIHPLSLRGRVQLWQHLLDSILGIAVMYYLVTSLTLPALADTFFHWANGMIAELQELLEWLMGVPAGLKLNSQLAKFLGKFFLYHIYLWTGYLHLIHPFMKTALWYITLSGWLGLTMQLSLLQDLISMMTLHIYCFYVYAARLYHLQMHCLGSLWRLFRGKKWNVLRQRVDSSSFDVDQLFIGTLLFTILLFLLPTTALYYIVHLALRLLVLGIQGALFKLVSFLNSVPAYILYLRFFHPRTISDDIQFHVLPTSPGRPLTLLMEFKPGSVLRLVKEYGGDQRTVKYTWSEFLKKILLGDLVYPWIESREAGHDKAD